MKKRNSPKRFKRPLKLSKEDHLLDFLGACLECDSPDVLEQLLRDIFTDFEVDLLAERWSVAKLLYMGFPYRTVMEKTGASSASVARISRLLLHGNGGLRSACIRREQQFFFDRPNDIHGPMFCNVFTASPL